MGCEDSKMSSHSYGQSPISVTIIDPGFLKQVNESLRISMQKQGVSVKTYMSVSCFIGQQSDVYSNNVLVRQQELEDLLEELKSIHSHPRIFALMKDSLKDKNKAKLTHKLKGNNVTYINSYQELAQNLNQKSIVPNKTLEKTFLDVKILKSRKGEGEPELFIFEQTLKVKGVSYRIYENFADLERQFQYVQAPLVITDYVFQHEVVTLLARHHKTKLVVYCKLDEEEVYHPSVAFFTNNFQEIVNQIVLLKAYKLPPLPTTKVFLCSSDKRFFRYKQTFQDFDLKVRCSMNLRDILGVTKFYFSLIVICPEEEKSAIQKQIAGLKVDFRVQVVGVMEDTENTAIGLRKIIREVKRGYLVEKGVCRLVDIIDKLHDDLKFQSVKEQLAKNNINYRCFNDFGAFERNQVYCAPLIICNYHQRHILGKYLDKVQSRAKVIIYCNKQKINEHLLAQKKWAFVSSHFGKVINFIRTNKALVPILLDHNQRRVQQKQQKIKNKQHRISALKWSDPNLAQVADKTIKFQPLPQVSFILPKLNVNPLEVKQISNDASALLKLPYEPPKNIDQFRQDLSTSLVFLKERYKLNFPEQAFKDLLDGITNKSLMSLAKRVKMFFGQQKQMGLRINDSLRKLEIVDQKQLRHLREVIYLINLNFLCYYEMQPIGTIKLVHWTKETLLEQCLPEGVVIFKNYMVMYEEGVIDPIPGCLKLELELEYNSLTDSNIPIVPYFCFEGRYVFAPYTQFKITGLSGQKQSIASLQLVKQPDFLSYYYQENISSNLSDYFLTNIQNEGTLIDLDNKHKVLIQIERCNILKMYRTGTFEKAAKRQKELLAQEQQSENIDSRCLTELLYQLANYQFKAGYIDDLLNTVAEVTNNNPPPLIKKDCATLLSKAKTQIGKENIVRNPLEVKFKKQKTIKCIELKETIEKVEKEERSENSEEQEEIQAEENNLLEYEKCLEIDDTFGDFEYFE